MEKTVFVIDIKSDEAVTDFFMAKTCNIKTGKDGRDYLDIILGDKTGEINSKKWNISPDEKLALSRIHPRDLVKIKGITKSWNGQLQMDIQRIRPAEEADNLNISDYIKAAPEKPQDMYDHIYGIAEKIEDQELRLLATTIMERNKQELLYWPAAARNHHAEYAGLLYHMRRMLDAGMALCEVYPSLDSDLIATGVIIHDMEKIREIDSDESGVADGYFVEGQMLGHLVQGVCAIGKLGEELRIDQEKILMLQHMVLSHHYEPEFGSPKKPMFLEAEVLHYLDIMDARIFDMEEALAALEGGEVSEKIFPLDNRRVYKRKF